MTLGPAFGAPPPSDFNEPHDLHHEPAPEDPDEHRHDASGKAEPAAGTDEARDEEPKGLSRWFGWLRRSG
jgi:hypothetical protein